MSKREAEIIKKLVEVTKDHVQVFPAIVKAVNEEDKTCTVETEGIDFYNVRLKATVNKDSDCFVVLPVVGSSVLVGLINNNENALYVVQVSQPEKLLLNIGESSLEVDAENGVVVNGGKDYAVWSGKLHEKLDNLVTEINGELAKIVTATGGAYVFPNPSTPLGISKFNKSDFENTKLKH